MNVTELTYSGELTLKIKVNDRFIEVKEHNKGEYYLFKLMAKLLSGLFQGNEWDVPTYVDIEYAPEVPGMDLEWRSFLKQPIKIEEPLYYPKENPNDSEKDKREKNLIVPYAQIIVALSSSNLLETVEPDQVGTAYRVCLKSELDNRKLIYQGDQQYHLMAWLPINVATLAKITPGTQASLTWIMKINSSKGGASNYLFRQIAKMLCNLYNGASHEKILLIDVEVLLETAESKWESCLNKLIYIQEPQYFPKEDDTTTLPYARITGVLRASDFKQPIQPLTEVGVQYRISLKSGYDVNSKALEDRDKCNLMVWMPVEASDLAKITEDTQATIVWILKTVNAERSSE